MIPVHNSSFDLAMHPWYEPLLRLSTAAAAYQVPLLTPMFGQPVLLAESAGITQNEAVFEAATEQWWRQLLPAEVQAAEILLPQSL
jgi:hypothetical protein